MKIYFIIVLSLISNHSLSQSPDTIPVINLKSTFDSSSLILNYSLTSKNEISIYKNLKIALRCDEEFMDVVFILEKLDETKQTYIVIPCGADVDPVYYADGTLGTMTKLVNSTCPDHNVTIQKEELGEGKYRIKIKFYYFVRDIRKFVESRYVYFNFSESK